MLPEEDIAFLSVVAARRALVRGDLSAEQYIGALLQRIADLNETYRAFASISTQAALEAARQADRKRAVPGKLPPLHGVPFAVKDLIDVRGEPTLANSLVPGGGSAPSTAVAVRQLQNLGAIYIGKLTLEEFGTGSQLDDPEGARPKNPWDVARSPGGSSNGSAVAVAAGMVPLALGTDTTGSVRAPAAYCGVVGLKPTAGLVSREGVQALAPSLDTIGLMARSAPDCGILISALLGRSPQPPRQRARIARIALGPLEELVTPALRASIDTALLQFEAADCTVVEVDQPPLRAMRGAARVIEHREAFHTHRERLMKYGALYQPQTRARLEAGQKITDDQYRHALAERTRFATAVDRLLETCEALALPVTLASAARFDDSEAMEAAGDVAFRAPFSLTGHPAIVFCTGFDEDGLPLAMQLIGRRGEDERLIGIVAAYQQVTDWHERRPPLSITEKSL